MIILILHELIYFCIFKLIIYVKIHFSLIIYILQSTNYIKYLNFISLNRI